MSEGSCNSPVDIILALDASGSVLKVNWEKSVDFTGSLAEKLLKLNPESRIGLIDFSQVANEAISLTSDRQGLNLRLETVRNSYQNGITRTELALNKALEMFNRINKQGRKKRLLVITDGVTTPLNGMVGLELLKMPSESLESAGVTIIVVGVGNQVNDEELNLMATDPDKENVFRIENYDHLPDMVGILSQAFCQVNTNKGKSSMEFYRTPCISMEFMYLVACEQALHLVESREVKRVPRVSRRSLSHFLAARFIRLP